MPLTTLLANWPRRPIAASEGRLKHPRAAGQAPSTSPIDNKPFIWELRQSTGTYGYCCPSSVKQMVIKHDNRWKGVRHTHRQKHTHILIGSGLVPWADALTNVWMLLGQLGLIWQQWAEGSRCLAGELLFPHFCVGSWNEQFILLHIKSSIPTACLSHSCHDPRSAWHRTLCKVTGSGRWQGYHAELAQLAHQIRNNHTFYGWKSLDFTVYTSYFKLMRVKGHEQIGKVNYSGGKQPSASWANCREAI